MSSVSKTFQELITFGRSTNATYVNSAGYIANTPVANYLTYSNQPENAAWTKSNSFIQTNLLLQSNDFETSWTRINITRTLNSILSPDGNVNGVKITATASAVTTEVQGATVAATAATASVYVKQGTGATTANLFALRNQTTLTDLIVGSLNYSTGVFTYTIGSTGVVVTNAGNGWWRIALSATTGITSGDTMRLYVGFTGIAQTAGDFLYAYGAQLVQGAVPGDYRATTSAALPCLYADYNGQLRARKLSETAVTNVHLLQNNLATVGLTQTHSVYAKAAERSQLYLQVGTSGAYFNLSTGAVISGSGATITLVRDGWYRCEIAASPVLTNTNVFVAVANGGANNYTGDGSSGIYIADTQLEPGTSVGPYYDTSLTLTYAPRFDYDPVTLAAKGLLIEESRTNLFTYSSSFNTQAPWGATVVTANVTTSPDGTMTGSLWVPVLGVANSYLYRSDQPTSAGTYTVSLYIKTAGLSEVLMGDFGNPVDGYGYATFNVAAGTIGTQVNLAAANIQAAGNGWYRCSITRVITSGVSNQVQIVRQKAGQVGNGVDGVYIWGAQLEQGAFATSYIPTVGSQLTRVADVASVNLFSQWYNSSAWTLYLEYVTKALAPVGGNTRVIELNNGTVSTRALFYSTPPATGDGLAFQVRDTGTDQTAPSFAGVNVVGAILKEAAAAKANDFAFTVNGVSPTVDVVGTLPTFSQFNIASVLSGSGTEVLSGHLRRITFYPQRLTNAQLQSITA